MRTHRLALFTGPSARGLADCLQPRCEIGHASDFELGIALHACIGAEPCLALRERDFVEAAVVGGASTGRIVVRHIVPNLMGPVIVYATLTLPQVILVESFLSFLGIGIQEPLASLGNLIADGAADFGDASKAEMLELLATLRGKVRDFVATLEPEDFAREPATEVHHPLFKSCGAALALVVSHAAYHAGQIANLRRAMGKDPLFG